jgi:hypothetical protein
MQRLGGLLCANYFLITKWNIDNNTRLKQRGGKIDIINKVKLTQLLISVTRVFKENAK